MTQIVMVVRNLIGAAAIAAVAAASTCASPITVTDTATATARSLLPPVGPPITTSNLVSTSGGRLLTNQFGGLVLGTEVRTVGAAPVASITDASATLSGIASPAGSTQLVAIFGVRGSITQLTTMGANATFTSGALQLVELPSGTAFAPNTVSSWGFGTGTVLGEWTLKAPEPIITGRNFGITAAQPLNFAASDVNVSGVNTAVGGLGQGLFLFDESSPNDTFLDSDSGLAGILSGLGFTIVSEDLGVQTNQSTTSMVGSDLGLGVMANQDILDAIAQYAFQLDFANWGSGGTDDFIVTLGGMNDITNGPGGVDFIANLSSDAFPGIQAQAVPEPASIVVWLAIGLVFSLGIIWRRRCAAA